MPNDLKRYVKGLQLDLAHLLQLTGGTEEERERYFEIVLGITRPAEFSLASYQIQAIHENVKLAQKGLETLTRAAEQMNQRS
ncbi:MAG: hypothetical protein ACJ76N_27760 [Thermoanaerobaculia bacterium]